MKKKLIAVLLTLSLSTLALAGCGNSDGKTERENVNRDFENAAKEKKESGEKLTINIGGSTGAGISYVIADEKGFFDEELKDLNAEVNFTLFSNGPEIASAQASGDIDFGAMGDQPALAAIAADYGITNIALDSVSTKFNQLYVASDTGINSLEELKGKKIGVSVGTVLEFQLLKFLESAGLNSDDVEIVNTKDAATLIESGEIDAAMSNVGAMQVLLNAGTVTALADGGDYNVLTTIWITCTDSFTNAHKEETAAILRAVKKANEYIEENTEEATDIISDTLQIDKALVTATLDTQHRTQPITEEALNAAEGVLKFLQDHDTIVNKDLKIEDTYTDEFWKLAE